MDFLEQTRPPYCIPASPLLQHDHLPLRTERPGNVYCALLARCSLYRNLVLRARPCHRQRGCKKRWLLPLSSYDRVFSKYLFRSRPAQLAHQMLLQIGNISSQAFGGMLYTRLGWRSICIYGLCFSKSSRISVHSVTVLLMPASAVVYSLILCFCCQEKPRAVRDSQTLAAVSFDADPTMDKDMRAADLTVNHSAWARLRFIFSDMRYVSALAVQWFNGFYVSGKPTHTKQPWNYLTDRLISHCRPRRSRTFSPLSRTISALCAKCWLHLPRPCGSLHPHRPPLWLVYRPPGR